MMMVTILGKIFRSWVKFKGESTIIEENGLPITCIVKVLANDVTSTTKFDYGYTTQ
jgi:hypothetical protein